MSHWRNRLALPVSWVLIAGAFACRNPAPPGELLLPDLTGRLIDPLRTSDARAVVFLFARTDCPISNRYAPEVRRLSEKFSARGVAFWLVYPDRGETVEALGKHIREYDYRCGVLRDPQHRLVRRSGARVTPEAAVFLPGGKIIYRGRIDDWYADFGKARPAPTTHDLEQVLEAVLDGRQVPRAEMPAVGCFIADLQ